MEQETKEATPRKRAAKAQNTTNDFTVKQVKSNERKTYIYVIDKGAGIYLSLPQNSITVYDESSNTVRSIRYCPNEPSIYTDDQSANALREHIVFREGLLPVALFLGINVNQETMGIKRELLREAKSNPVGFVKMFDNPQVKTRSAIMQAIDFQILRNSAEGMYWFDSNRLIVSTPAGMDSVDVMTRFCLTEKGAPVYEQILARLNDIV
jgi:hypothetical protein